MYRDIVRAKGSISRNISREGESIEKALQRMKQNNETDLTGKSLVYTRPEQGVVYGTDIRGDKFSEAIKIAAKVTDSIESNRVKKYEERKAVLEAKRAEKAAAKVSNSGNEGGKE